MYIVDASHAIRRNGEFDGRNRDVPMRYEEEENLHHSGQVHNICDGLGQRRVAKRDVSGNMLLFAGDISYEYS